MDKSLETSVRDKLKRNDETSTKKVQAIGESLTACLFEFIELVSTWSTDENLCTKVTEVLVDAADQLEAIQFGVDVATATGNGFGVLSGFVGVVGFGLLFNPLTVLPGVIVLAVSGGTGGIGLVTELSAKVHNWRTEKKLLQNVEEVLSSFAKIDYNKLNAFTKKLQEQIVELNVEMKKTNDKINEEVATLCVISFFHDVLCSYEDICHQYFAEEDKAINEYWTEYYEAIIENWNLQTYDEISKVFSDQNMNSIDKLKKEVNFEKMNALKNKDLIMDLCAPTKLVEYSTNFVGAATAANDAGISLKSSKVLCVSSVAKSFGSLSKGAQVITGLGVAFSILSIPLGGYGMYSSINNIMQNAKENRSLNQESVMIRFNAALIELGIHFREI